jgi:hypothetical protein
VRGKEIAGCASMIQKALNESRIRVVAVKNKKLVTKLEGDFGLGRGEAEAIALALAEKAQVLGIDDKNGINACKLLGIAFTTAIGILVRMREKRLLTIAEALCCGRGRSLRRSGPRALGLHKLSVQSDGDVVTHQNSSGLESYVPGQAEVLATDLGARRDPNSGVPPGILGRRRWPFHRKPDLARHPADGQVAFHRQFFLTHDSDVRRLEVQGGKLFNVEEIGALEMSIALLVAGLDGSSFNRGLHAVVRRV